MKDYEVTFYLEPQTVKVKANNSREAKSRAKWQLKRKNAASMVNNKQTEVLER